jgi:hypothetical protein
MWQRIQTIFLAFIIIALGALLWLPIWEKTTQNVEHRFLLDAWKLQRIYLGTGYVARMPYGLAGILSLLGIALAGYELLLFKKRAIQIKIGALNNLVLVTLLGLITYWALHTDKAVADSLTVRYRIGFFMPIVAIVSNILANYFIRKDEALVQAANRIR